MSENAVRIGLRIRAARDVRGWSQGELAARLKRTQTAVSYWESGRRALGVDDLIDIATALGVPPSDLLPGTIPQQSVAALLRTVADRLGLPELGDTFEQLAVATLDLAARPAQWTFSPAGPRDTAEALLELGRISKPPVPVETLATNCGVRLLAWDLDNVDTVLIEVDDGPVIVHPAGLAGPRFRMAIAHAFGHHLLRHADVFHVDFTGELAPSATGGHPGFDWRVEEAATDFAANLLMPAPMIRAAHSRSPDVPTLASRFGVGPAAIGVRLAALALR